jgi:hypothetical protein
MATKLHFSTHVAVTINPATIEMQCKEEEITNEYESIHVLHNVVLYDTGE